MTFCCKPRAEERRSKGFRALDASVSLVAADLLTVCLQAASAVPSGDWRRNGIASLGAEKHSGKFMSQLMEQYY